MSDLDTDPVVSSVSRKSSVSSSTGSSFENVDRVESSEQSEAQEEPKEEKLAGDEQEGNEEEEEQAEEEVDPLDAPMKQDQEQFYTARDSARAIKLLIMFSSAMFTLPLLTMFSMYHYVFIDHFHLPPDQAMLYAGGCGVAVVIVIVSSFVYIAYKEEVEAERRLKKLS